MILKQRIKNEADRIRKKKATDRLPRVGAYHAGRALDAALALCGSGLKVWEDNGSCPLLQENERRYFVPAKRPLPGDVPVNITPKRSCIFNDKTKTTRYDVPRLSSADDEDAVLTIAHDEGPKEESLFWWLCSTRSRILHLEDPLHRHVRDMAGVAKATNMWSAILDTSAVVNYDHGPFLSSANFAKTKEAIQQWAHVAAEDDEFAMQHFQDMCEASEDFPPDYGTKEHIARVIKELPFDKCMEALQHKVKWTRWGSHDVAMVKFLPDKPKKQFALALVRFFTSDTTVLRLETMAMEAPARPSASGGQLALADTTLASSSSSSAPSSSKASLAAKILGIAPPPRRSRGASSSSAAPHAPPAGLAAQGDVGKKTETRKSNNPGFQKPTGIDDVIKILEDPETWSRIRVWHAHSKLMWSSSADEYKGFMDDDQGCASYYIGYSQGLFFNRLAKLFDGFSNRSTLELAGHFVWMNAHERALAKDRSSALWLAEQSKAQQGWDVVVETCRFKGQSQAHYYYSYPGKFAGLLSKSSVSVMNTLAYMSRCWCAMQYFEKNRTIYKEFADLWFNVPCFSWTVIREIMVLCAEVEFKCVPLRVTRMVQSIFAWGSSLVNERGFWWFRERLAKTRNKMVSPVTGWKALADSTTFDDFKRANLKPSECQEKPLLTLNSESFKPKSYEPTIKKFKYDDIMKSPKTWHPYTGLSKHTIPAALSLMLLTFENGEYDCIQSVWHSLVPLRKDVIQESNDGPCFIVLATSRFGVWVWPCDLIKKSAAFNVVMPHVEEARPFWLHIFDAKKWSAFEVSAVPPCEAIAKKQPVRIVLEASGPQSLLTRAATFGFENLTSVYMDKLIRDLKLLKPDFPRPSTTMEKAALLVQHFLPHLSHQSLMACLAKRGSSDKERAPLLQVGSELCDSVMEQDDKQSLKEMSEAHSKNTESREAFKESLTVGSHFLEVLGKVISTPKAKAKSKTVKLTKIADLKKIADDKAAQKFMPIMKGAHIELRPLPKNCWTAYYPHCAPGSRTRTFGSRFSKPACLKHCLMWAWREHEKQHPVSPCPWKFVA